MYKGTSCAIRYTPEAYTHETLSVVGRRSAGNAFLKAFALHFNDMDYFACVTESTKEYELFTKKMVGYGCKSKPFFHISSKDIYNMNYVGNVFWPDPRLDELAWLRSLHKQSAFSICGITHTLSENEVILALQNALLAPIRSWDALICTSKAAQDVVKNIHSEYSHYLKDQIGCYAQFRGLLPIIPLGVHMREFRRTNSRTKKAGELRKFLNIAEKDVVGLYFGRLDFLKKAQPTPIFLAMELAQRELSNISLHLMVVGQFGDRLNEREIKTLAANFSPGIRIHWFDGNDSDITESCWHVADFFISLPDNVQETFGLTVLEAMAASLPCIVSDWSGLKETVVHGKTGFRIPTVTPPANVGSFLKMRRVLDVDSYEESIGAAGQYSSVRVRECKESIVTLAKNAELRRAFGYAGYRRVVECYEWRIIMERYRELWCELDAIRNHAENAVSGVDEGNRYVPGHSNFFSAFASFPSAVLDENSLFCADQYALTKLKQVREYYSHMYMSSQLFEMSDMELLIQSLQRRTRSVDMIFSHFRGAYRRVRIYSTLAWLLKYDIIELG